MQQFHCSENRQFGWHFLSGGRNCSDKTVFVVMAMTLPWSVLFREVMKSENHHSEGHSVDHHCKQFKVEPFIGTNRQNVSVLFLKYSKILNNVKLND
jgi:hypothetical protein